MIQRVSVLGVGQIPVARHERLSVAQLGAWAGSAAMADAGVVDVDAIFVGNMLARDVTGQSHLGPLIASAMGNDRVEGVAVNAACGSGGAVVRQAALAVASGAYDVVLAVGVEKMSGIPKDTLTRALALGGGYGERSR